MEWNGMEMIEQNGNGVMKRIGLQWNDLRNYEIF